ncbi:MAG: transcription-repair coupling factor [Oscillospiraceae bacterium]|nr:transcription-repair coupling factor [Oscillospiraceae bacterium]
MDALLDAILKIPELNELTAALDGGVSPAALTGVQSTHRAIIAAAAARRLDRPLLFICADDGDARRLCGDLSTILPDAPVYLPARELSCRVGAVVSRDWERSRIAALHRMSCGEARAVVATVDALLLHTMPCDLMREASFTLCLGARHDPAALSMQLVRAGYRRCEQVEGAGQFALRGGILDVFSPLMDAPVRCEFFDDEIDSLGIFDPATQRRTQNVDCAQVLPASEVLLTVDTPALFEKLTKLSEKAAKRGADKLSETLRADAGRVREGLPIDGTDRYLDAVCADSTALDYIDESALVFVSETARVTERIRAFHAELRADAEVLLEEGILAGEFASFAMPQDAFAARISDFCTVMSDALPTSRYLLPPREIVSLTAKQLPSYGGSLETAASDMAHYLGTKNAVVVFCGNEQRARNLQRLLEEHSIEAALRPTLDTLPRPGQAVIALGALSSGAEFPQLLLVLMTEGQLAAPAAPRAKTARAKKKSAQQKLQSYTDLSPGDLVVHEHHGLGRFVGIFRMSDEGVERDYVKIAYAGSDSLYVPATQLDLVSKFIGSGEDTERTRLNKLGGTDWSRTKSRAKAAAKDLAKGLIALYAERQRQPGFAFSPDSPWQREFEDAFDYVETDDQLRCIEEIKRDMERPTPMDRLLCGDVGYGKTEVALRAVMKCILDGKQAAFLVPTTVLAQQHHATALARFRSFPVRIEVLSRFKTPAQKKAILEQAAQGKIDLLIGTHSLLQKNLQFKDLGLLIVDEEQRFGVSHKEKLKEMSRQVDVLTLTATPIPRTLNMALSGIRDMSTLEQPPHDRKSVHTYVLEHDWGVLADAMRREIARGGQVYYLHNRTETIDRCAARIRAMLGDEVRIVTAHGRMSERELGSVMQAVVGGEADILVCTTIIETGIDIPNVNTLIVEDADHLGLAQMHQLRGRIGRSARRAYAYMTYRTGKVLTEASAKRLSAIREYAEFGSGFKIAMRDLEIRGAGNLLGAEQSGYMMSVGYDLYLRLLEDAVLEERGGAAKRRTDCSADLRISANIPESYVPSAEQRMDLYRRIAAVRTSDDSADILDELMDRYGEVPKSVLALLDVALLRAAGAKVCVSEITQRGDDIQFTFTDDLPLKAITAVCAMARYRRRLQLASGAAATLTLHLQSGDDPLESALALLEELRLQNEAE